MKTRSRDEVQKLVKQNNENKAEVTSLKRESGEARNKLEKENKQSNGDDVMRGKVQDIMTQEAHNCKEERQNKRLT